MTWFKVDDGFWSHPKTATLSDAAVTLWVRAGSYCCQHLTDGFVKHAALRMLGTTNAAVELVDADLWHIVTDGWTFHDWDEYQETSVVVKKRRDDARERQRKLREQREEQRRQSQSESPRDIDVTDIVTNCVTDGVSSQPPTRPDPTRPDPTQLPVPQLVSGGYGGAATKTRRRSAPRAQLSDGWHPDQDAIQRMRAQYPHLDLKAECEAFTNHHQAHGNVMADWTKAFWTWLGNTNKFGPNGKTVTAINAKPPHKMRVLAELAAKQRAVEEAQAIEGRKELV